MSSNPELCPAAVAAQERERTLRRKFTEVLIAVLASGSATNELMDKIVQVGTELGLLEVQT